MQHDHEDRRAARIGITQRVQARRHARDQGRHRSRGRHQGDRAAQLGRRDDHERSQRRRRPGHALGPARGRRARPIRASIRCARRPTDRRHHRQGTKSFHVLVPRRHRRLAGHADRAARPSTGPRTCATRGSRCKNLTLNVGVRYEEQQLRYAAEPARHDRSADRQPRSATPRWTSRATSRRGSASRTIRRTRAARRSTARGAGSTSRSRWTSTIARSAARSATSRRSTAKTCGAIDPSSARRTARAA